MFALAARRNRDRIAQAIRRESHLQPGIQIRDVQRARIASHRDAGVQVRHGQNGVRIVTLKAASDSRGPHRNARGDAHSVDRCNRSVVRSPRGVVGVFVIRSAVRKRHALRKCLRPGNRNRRVRRSNLHRRDEQIAYG